MIFRDAMKSLRFGRAQALFYWLTLLLTTMFLYLYFIMMMSDPVTAGFLMEGTDFTATAITITVVLICMIAILFANDFFVRRKAKELAVRLISGATYTQLSMYLLLQTLVLMLAAMPVGILIGYLLLPVLSAWVSVRTGVPFAITVKPDGIMMASVFLGFVVFWIIMLNLSFAYRNAANMMFNTSALTKTRKSGVLYVAGMSAVKKILAVLLFIGPVIMFFLNPHAIFLFGLMSAVGLHMFLQNIMVPYLTAQNASMDNAPSAAARGFLRSDFQTLGYSISLYFIDAVLLLAALTMKDGQPVEMAMYLLSYAVMNVMLSLAILFQFATDMTSRVRVFATLAHIGFSAGQRRQVQDRELGGFFAFLLFLVMLYIVSILVSVCLIGRIGLSFALVLFAVGIAPLAVCYILCIYYYRKIVQV